MTDHSIINNMYQAEIHGKLPRTLAYSEDILTSNVFSFFKYANRKLFLYRYLNGLGINVSESQAESAVFDFWPTFDDYTEPDLVLMVGDYYVLVEAKYTSSFGKERGDIQHQLIREYHGGKTEAEKLDKTFILLTITADPFYHSVIFQGTPDWLVREVLWTHWQGMTIFLEKILEENPNIRQEDLIFAKDLKDLLIKKRLRAYIGKDAFELDYEIGQLPEDFIFFDASTAEYGRIFEGFQAILPEDPVEETKFLFYSTTKMASFFDFDLRDDVEENQGYIFYRR